MKGAAYHVRVSAYNGVALSYGKTRPSTPPVVYPGDIPAAPSRVEVEEASPTSLAISWAPPNDVMGVDVLAYKVVCNNVYPRMCIGSLELYMDICTSFDWTHRINKLLTWWCAIWSILVCVLAV